jgi:hypothetical protein
MRQLMAGAMLALAAARNTPTAQARQRLSLATIIIDLAWET